MRFVPWVHCVYFNVSIFGSQTLLFITHAYFQGHVPGVSFLNRAKLGFPGGSVAKDPPHNAGDWGLIPGSGRYLGEGNSNPLQYSCLENPIPWTEEPGGLQFMGSQRVGHD